MYKYGNEMNGSETKRKKVKLGVMKWNDETNAMKGISITCLWLSHLIWLYFFLKPHSKSANHPLYWIIVCVPHWV